MTAWQKDWILSDPACQENAPQPGGDCGATGSMGFLEVEHEEVCSG